MVEESEAIYEVTPNNKVTSEEVHPILLQLIEKSKIEIAEGKGISHEEAMKRIKQKFPFLK